MTDSLSKLTPDTLTDECRLTLTEEALAIAAERGGPTKARVDQWLWAVRQFKTRSAATAACKAGHVRVNGAHAKAAQSIAIGDEVRVRIEGFDRYLLVRGILLKRVGAPIARQAYVDFSPPRPSRLDAPAPILRDRGSGRPTKKERRALDRLRAMEPVVDIEHLLDEN